MVRNYLDWIVVNLPWRKKRSKVKTDIDLKVAERVLEEDHYGLEKDQRSHP